jgi:hypothetical protein
MGVQHVEFLTAYYDPEILDLMSEALAAASRSRAAEARSPECHRRPHRQLLSRRSSDEF